MIEDNIGCPVGNGGRECCRGCGGWFKQYDRGRMLYLLRSDRLDPQKMPCGTLREQALRLQKELKEQEREVREVKAQPERF